ncbi:YjbF family lipoprotein [Amaricoccus sp.]|uniref:YjbF family lipoprotein n=1 Tax=Amaricoccus sp. TaxID=1872485 RepID=UPI002610CC39|nr:YjbF family lipoprotein [uncultured Amaricoccus sp.]
MTRRILAAAALLLAGCTNQGFNPILVEAVNAVNPWDAPDEAAAAKGQPVTRAAIDKADVATIRARLVADQSPTYLFAASNNGGYVTYASSLRQTLTLRGSQVTASRGLGWDLLSATSSQPDPLTRAIPPGQWPRQVTRSYEFPSITPAGQILSFTCRFEFGDVTEMVILDQRHRGVQVSETCAGPTGSFENLHFADVSTGFVWRTLQWLGPRQGLVDIEIVLPYTGNPR